MKKVNNINELVINSFCIWQEEGKTMQAVKHLNGEVVIFERPKAIVLRMPEL